MFKSLLLFFKNLFKRKDIKYLEENNSNPDNNMNNFKSGLKFTDKKNFLDEILNMDNSNLKSQEDLNVIQGRLVNHIDVLIKRIDEFKADIILKQTKLKNTDN